MQTSIREDSEGSDIERKGSESVEVRPFFDIENLVMRYILAVCDYHQRTAAKCVGIVFVVEMDIYLWRPEPSMGEIRVTWATEDTRELLQVTSVELTC